MENAIVHGLENKDSHGTVLITGEKQNNLVVFTVSDNGVGMDDARITAIMQDDLDTSPNHTGLGIITVHKRVQFIYGQEYGIQIHSVVNAGTTITLTFPYQKKQSYTLR